MSRTPVMLDRRRIALGLATLPLVSACGPSEPKTPLAHLYGQDWVKGSYELYAKGYAGVQTRAETRSFETYGVLAKKGIVALDGLQTRGVPFFVRVDRDAKAFAIERNVPERLTFTSSMSEKDREVAKASFERAREHLHTDYEEIRRLNGALTTLLGELSRVRAAIEEGKLEQYKLVRLLEPLGEGQPPFQLPYQVSVKDYEGVVYLLLERLEDDQKRLAAVEASMVAVGLTARATDDGSGSLAANVRKVLVAVAKDAEAGAPRPPAFPEGEREALLGKGKALAERIKTSEPYAVWLKKEKAKAFEQVGGLLSVIDRMTGLPLSAVYQQVLDIWRGDADYLSYVRMVVSIVPGGSAIAKTLDDAASRTEKARDVIGAADSPEKIAAAAQKKGIGLVNTSEFGAKRAKKQLVFFGNEREAAEVEEALRATHFGALPRDPRITRRSTFSPRASSTRGGSEAPSAGSRSSRPCRAGTCGETRSTSSGAPRSRARPVS